MQVIPDKAFPPDICHLQKSQGIIADPVRKGSFADTEIGADLFAHIKYPAGLSVPVQAADRPRQAVQGPGVHIQAGLQLGGDQTEARRFMQDAVIKDPFLLTVGRRGGNMKTEVIAVPADQFCVERDIPGCIRGYGRDAREFSLFRGCRREEGIPGSQSFKFLGLIAQPVGDIAVVIKDDRSMSSARRQDHDAAGDLVGKDADLTDPVAVILGLFRKMKESDPVCLICRSDEHGTEQDQGPADIFRYQRQLVGDQDCIVRTQLGFNGRYVHIMGLPDPDRQKLQHFLQLLPGPDMEAAVVSGPEQVFRGRVRRRVYISFIKQPVQKGFSKINRCLHICIPLSYSFRGMVLPLCAGPSGRYFRSGAREGTRIVL